jgi:hypothetical protein
MSELSRRSLVASASALPALAIPAVTFPAQAETLPLPPDPVFAIIDAHRTALLSAMRATKIICETPNDQRTKEGDLAEDRADAAEREATWELIGVVPTTFAGVFGLMEYVDELHIGKIALPEEPNQWFVAWDDGGRLKACTFEDADDKLVSPFNGEPLDLPLTFWVMRNVQTALRSLTGAAA